MLKALLKKQFLQMSSVFRKDPKTGKLRSKQSAVLFVLLYLFVFVSFGYIFFEMSSIIAQGLIGTEYDWLLFGIFGLMALAVGVIGSAFLTCNSLFQAKDNELLLSMPIPPAKILTVRMLSIYLLSLLFTAVVLIPSSVAWAFAASAKDAFSILPLINQFLLLLFLTLVTLTLSCIAGWGVATLISRMKKKNILTVVLYLVFIAAYYYLYSQANLFMQKIVADPAAYSSGFHGIGYVFYLYGKAATGEPGSLLIFMAISAILFLACVWVLSRTFLQITTRNRGEKKTQYREKSMENKGFQAALLRKEWKRFLGSTTYLMNAGFGVFVLPIASVAALIKMGAIRTKVAEILEQMPTLEGFLPVVIFAAVLFFGSMIIPSACSVSLEGKNVWILQSLPVSTESVLQAKLKFHMELAALPVLLFTVVMGIVLQLEFACIALCAAVSLVYVYFSGLFGLTLNLKAPNLTWTNEAVAVKQSMPALVSIFGSWFLAVLVGGGFYFLQDKVSETVYMVIWIAILALACRFLYRWLMRKGTKIFAAL